MIPVVMVTANMQVICDNNHKYFVDGINKPGFSEICEDLGFPKNPYWTEEGRAEGIALSQWLLFLAQGKEPESEPDPRIAGRVEGIRKFLKEHDFKFVGGEQPLYYQELGYCVTPDIWGYFDGMSGLIEAKRGNKLMRHRLQTSAQDLALEENGFPIVQRTALYLRDGDYELDFHTDDEDFEVWQTLVYAYHAKRSYL